MLDLVEFLAIPLEIVGEEIDARFSRLLLRLREKWNRKTKRIA